MLKKLSTISGEDQTRPTVLLSCNPFVPLTNSNASQEKLLDTLPKKGNLIEDIVIDNPEEGSLNDRCGGDYA
jgi:hypothetical protein